MGTIECPNCKTNIPGLRWKSHSLAGTKRLKDELKALGNRWYNMMNKLSHLECAEHVDSIARYLDEAVELLSSSKAESLIPVAERATSPIPSPKPDANPTMSQLSAWLHAAMKGTKSPDATAVAPMPVQQTQPMQSALQQPQLQQTTSQLQHALRSALMSQVQQVPQTTKQPATPDVTPQLLTTHLPYVLSQEFNRLPPNMQQQIIAKIQQLAPNIPPMQQQQHRSDPIRMNSGQPPPRPATLPPPPPFSDPTSVQQRNVRNNVPRANFQAPRNPGGWKVQGTTGPSSAPPPGNFSPRGLKQVPRLVSLKPRQNFDQPETFGNVPYAAGSEEGEFAGMSNRQRKRLLFHQKKQLEMEQAQPRNDFPEEPNSKRTRTENEEEDGTEDDVASTPRERKGNNDPSFEQLMTLVEKHFIPKEAHDCTFSKRTKLNSQLLTMGKAYLLARKHVKTNVDGSSEFFMRANEAELSKMTRTKRKKTLTLRRLYVVAKQFMARKGNKSFEEFMHHVNYGQNKKESASSEGTPPKINWKSPNAGARGDENKSGPVVPVVSDVKESASVAATRDANANCEEKAASDKQFLVPDVFTSFFKEFKKQNATTGESKDQGKDSKSVLECGAGGDAEALTVIKTEVMPNKNGSK